MFLNLTLKCFTTIPFGYALPGVVEARLRVPQGPGFWQCSRERWDWFLQWGYTCVK